MVISIRTVFYVLALICFILAAIGYGKLGEGTVHFEAVPAGLACLTAGWLFGTPRP